MPELLIFDCDGTLVDSETLYNSITAKLLNELGFPEYTTTRCIELFAGQTWTNIRKTLNEKHGAKISSNIIERYIKETNQAIDTDLHATQGALDVLKTVQTTKKICIASNGERTNVLKSLKITNLLPFFDPETQIFTKIQVKHAKPAPDLFLFAAERMNTRPENCLVIEDSVTGVLAAKAANMNTIGFTGTAHNPTKATEALKNAGADHICTDLIHILEITNITENLCIAQKP